MNCRRHNPVRAARRPRPRRGFTLVELMTVILVLMVLIAIGVPSIQAARRQFLANVSYARLNIIQGACNAYRADWEEFPPSSYSGGAPEGRYLLVRALVGFLDAAQDGQDGLGARKAIEGSTKLGGRLYGPYNGSQDVPVLISGTRAGQTRAFIDAFGNEFYYYRFTGTTYNASDNSTGGPTNLDALLKNADGTFWRKDYVIMSKGYDGVWDLTYIGNPKRNDTTNFVSE